MTAESAPPGDAELEERIRELYRRLGIVPSSLPLPPEDAALPVRHWQERTEDRDDDAETGGRTS